jgi:uncharacterized membrane protein YfhO
LNRRFKKNVSDQAILRDNTDFRVFNPLGGFSNARTSYFHKSIAGYHAAKPKRIQNLFDFYISKNNMDILSMLNVKYLIQVSEENPIGVTRNPNNLGNAWFVEQVTQVNDSDEELLALGTTDLKSICLTQDKNIDQFNYQTNNEDFINLISRKANELIYETSANSNQFAVFSEAFYKNGWQAYIDDKPVNHYKVNYLLRGMEVPKGNHILKFVFNPQVVKNGVYISIFSYLVLIIVFIKFIFDKKNV